MRQLDADKGIHRGGHRQEGSERHGILHVLAPGRDEHGPHECPEDGAHEHHEKQRLPPQEGPDHGQQLDVASPHPLPLRQELIPHGDQVEKPAPGENAEERVPEADTHDEDRQQEEHRDSRQRDHVRDDLVVQVDEADHDKDGDEKEGGQVRQARTVQPAQGQGEQARQQFDQGVAGRDGPAAVAAPAAQEKPAQDGDIVPGTDGCAALRTAGGGEHDGFLLGDPPDADVEETADHRAEDKRNNAPEYAHSLFRIFMSPCRSR